jgi:PAS domain S-box-containing protein
VLSGPRSSPHNAPRRVLIVHEEDEYSSSLRELLDARFYRTALTGDPEDALKLLARFEPPVAIIDVRLGQRSGLDVLSRIKAERPHVICIMITSHVDNHEAILALRRGAYDYYDKTAAPADLYAMLNRAFEKHRLEAQRLEAEHMLQAKSQQLDMALNNISQGLCMFDAQARLVLCNTRYLEMYGLSPAVAVPGITLRELMEHHRAARRLVADPGEYCQQILASVARGETASHVIQTTDGRFIHVVNHSMTSGGWVATHEDISGLRMAEKERDRSAEVLSATVDSLVDAVLVIDAQGKVLLANPAAVKLFGHRRDVAAEDWAAQFERLPADGTTEFPLHETPIARAMRGEPVDNVETALRPAGAAEAVHLVVNARPLRDTSGALTGTVVVCRDVTASKETERQLRHVQKMEAIGKLTGGVAHDFNNILTVITGTIEILADAVADQPKFAAIAKMIAEAAERGAGMTRQLLAFARKQPLQPRQTDINALIAGTSTLLRASLGEQVTLETRIADAPWPALVDPSQLTTAILNLAVNARDAMPNGGKLGIETANVELGTESQSELQPGAYVMVSVTDTGTGIPPSIRDKVFEPFFTTKGVGKGTGLGLSMVYGFVKQSGGHVRIVSEEGRGTSITIYLPRAAVPGVQAVAAQQEGGVLGGRETVLIVEDDALVRSYVVAQIQGLGYRTHEAANAVEALTLVARGTPFDLLFTDVIMPGAMNGCELAREVARLRPQAKIVFTSGYSENALVHDGRVEPGVRLLQKPYRKAELARMFRDALDEPAPSIAPDAGERTEALAAAG